MSRWLGLLSLALGLSGVALGAPEVAVRPVLVQNAFIDAAVLFGSLFILSAGIGMWRFPDAYTRAHASAKLVTIGGLSIFGGASVAFFPVDESGRLLLTGFFFLLTTPVASYMIIRAAYLSGVSPYWEADSADEWNALGDRPRDFD